MKHIFKNQKSLIDILAIVISSIILKSFLETIKISGETNFTAFFIDLLFVLISYLASYFLLLLFLRKQKDSFDFVFIVLNSFLGSFLLAVYDFIKGIYSDWNYLAKNPNDLHRHISESIFVILVILVFTLIFSFIYSLIMGIADAILNRKKNKLL